MKIKLLSGANSAWLLLAGAIVLAALMSFAVLRYLQERERALQDQVVEKARGGPKVMVAVPMRDVPAGTFVTRDVFVSRPIDSDLVYPDMVKVDEFDQFANRKTLFPVLRGRPLRIGDIDSADRPLAMSVPRGYRAITVTTDSTNSIANMIRPGDLVDLYLIATPATATGPSAVRADAAGDVSSLLLQKMTVLATGRQVFDKTAREQPRIVADEGAPATPTIEYDTLTLQATPEDASRLALAQKVGSLRAVLRGINDSDVIKSSTISSGSLFPSADPEGLNLRSVQYIVGGQGDAAVSNRTMPALASALAAAGARGAPTAPTAAAATPAPTSEPRQLTIVPSRTPSSNGSEPSVFFPQQSGAARR